MDALICKAIAERRLIRFVYKGAVRTVEPHAYGRKGNGADALCGWQLSGGSGQEFRLFRMDGVGMLQLTDDHFDEPRPGYRCGDSRFRLPHAEL